VAGKWQLSTLLGTRFRRAEVGRTAASGLAQPAQAGCEPTVSGPARIVVPREHDGAPESAPAWRRPGASTEAQLPPAVVIRGPKPSSEAGEGTFEAHIAAFEAAMAAATETLEEARALDIETVAAAGGD